MKEMLRRNHLRVCSVLVSALGFALYLIPLGRRFAVLDDYRKVLEVSDGLRLFDVSRGMSGTLWNTGRVIPALLSGIVWRFATDVSQLAFMRFVAFVAVLISIVALIQMLKMIEAPNKAVPHVLATTVLGFSSLLFLPSVAATVTFATLAIPLISVPSAVCAGLLLGNRRLTTRQILSSTFLIFCSVFSYQQMAVLVVLPVFFATALHYTRGWSQRQALKRCLLVVLLLGAALAANLAFMWVASDDALRRATTASISDRLRSLISSYLPKSFHLFLEKDPALFATSLAMFVFVGLVSIAFWRPAKVLLIAVFSSYAISSILFLGTDGDASYRVVFLGQLTLWGGLVLTFVISIINSNNTDRKYLRGVVLVPCLLLGLLVTQGHEIAYERISAANESDLRNLECHLARNYDTISTSETVIIQLKAVELTGPNGVHSEIGLLGSQVDWVASDMWNIVTSSDSRYSSLKQIKVMTVSSDEVVNDPGVTVILNLAETC